MVSITDVHLPWWTICLHSWVKWSISALTGFLVITPFMNSFLAIISITRWGHIPILEVVILGQIEQMAKFHLTIIGNDSRLQNSLSFFIFFFLNLFFSLFLFSLFSVFFVSTVSHELCKLHSRPRCLSHFISFLHLLLIFPYPPFCSDAFSLPFLCFCPLCAFILQFWFTEP